MTAPGSSTEKTAPAKHAEVGKGMMEMSAKFRPKCYGRRTPFDELVTVGINIH